MRTDRRNGIPAGRVRGLGLGQWLVGCCREVVLAIPALRRVVLVTDSDQAMLAAVQARARHERGGHRGDNGRHDGAAGGTGRTGHCSHCRLCLKRTLANPSGLTRAPGCRWTRHVAEGSMLCGDRRRTAAPRGEMLSCVKTCANVWMGGVVNSVHAVSG